jgi:hypothetical protein
LAYNRKWLAENPDKARASRQRRYAKNRKVLNKRSSDCARKKKYGLTPEAFRARLAAQGFACAICLSTDPRSKFGWHVDHCHATGRVRDILCNHCNVALGRVNDSTDVLCRMIAYLKKHSG